MNTRLTTDLTKAFTQRVIQLGMDHTDHRYELDPVEIQAILLTGASSLVQMAAAIDARLDGEIDATKCLNNKEHALRMLDHLRIVVQHAANS